ncbi:hypothetical protein RKD23_003223 [Streptomyces sp. SAI-170]
MKRHTAPVAWLRGGWIATGTRRHYDATTRAAPNGSSVEVSFCADTGKFYGKEVKTGKVLKTDPSPEDFGHYKVTGPGALPSTPMPLRRPVGSARVWRG